MMKIDCHLHTSNYSGCADSSLKEQMKAAYDKGLDAVFITEHMVLHPEKELERYRKKFFPMKIFQAIEVTVQDAGWEDFVVLGIHDPKINGDKWTYSRLHQFVHERGGFIIHAHPFRYRDHVQVNTTRWVPDAVEVYTSNINKTDLQKRLDYIERIGSRPIINSDSHNTRNTGKFYTELNRWCETEDEIIAALLADDYDISECLD
jgi:predicted metal-dependent phosphoesterase TrpH